jgi:AhpD family alkylhydroperoxidase
MAHIAPKPLQQYPWYLRWFFRWQARRYGQTLSPSWLWARWPTLFGAMLLLLGSFQRRKFPIDTELRSLVSARVAQLNGCAFCVDLNSYNLLMAVGSASKAQAVSHWRESSLYSARERAALEYAEAMTDTSQRVKPEQIAALRTYFDDDALTALTAWIAFQNMSAKFNAALGAEDTGLCRLPVGKGS